MIKLYFIKIMYYKGVNNDFIDTPIYSVASGCLFFFSFVFLGGRPTVCG